MDVVARRSGGQNIVGRPQARPNWNRPATAPAARAQVWKRNADQSPASAVLVGVFELGKEYSIDFNPAADRNVLLGVNPLSADGTPSFSRPEDYVWATVLFQRETAAPTVTQAGEATRTEVTLEIGGFSQFARRRKVRVADNSSMTGATETVTAATGAGLPRTVVINRAETETDAQTIYVRVSHSSSADGPFGAESAAQAFTFADSLGAGGSSGDGDPYGRQQIPL